jgi:FkbM family methyltransferase
MTAQPWNWSAFKGSSHALKYARRDLPCLDAVIARTPGRTAVVQAGGNVGIFPKRLAQHFETVYTFEPGLDLFPLLYANAPEPNIVKFQAALGDTRGLIGLSRSRRKTAKPGIEHEGLTHVDGAGVVPVLRVDDLALPVCDLMYLDLEGYELYALHGAADTIRRCRPVIAVEVNQNIAYYGQTAEDLRATLAAFGYARVDIQASDEVFAPVERAA